MAKISDMIQAFQVTGLDANSLKETARRLREAGMIKSGRAGRYGGAEMAPDDAAAFLIALIGPGDTRDVIHAAKTVELIAPLQAVRYSNFTDTERRSPPIDGKFFGLDERHTFAQAVERLIAESRDCGLTLPAPHHVVMRLEVSVERTPWPTAKIQVWAYDGYLCTAHYEYPREMLPPIGKEASEQLAWLKYCDEKFGGKQNFYSVIRTVHLEVFWSIGKCLRG